MVIGATLRYMSTSCKCYEVFFFHFADRRIGERSSVWAEREIIEKAAAEFDQVSEH